MSVALGLKTQLQVVGEAHDGLSAIQKVIELKPDVVVLDIGLPDMSGVTVAEEILKYAPSTRVIFLTENTSPEIVRAALHTGAQGYVVKSCAARDLIPALDAVMLNAYFVSSAATAAGVKNLFCAPVADH